MTLNGILFFPVTPFAGDGTVDVPTLRTHIEERIADGAGAVFAGCGTGEFNSLDADEVLLVAQTAVEAAAGRVPVFVGVGGGGTTSRAVLERLERLGVDGLLLLPPYLIAGTQAGLAGYVERVASLTRLGIIVYQRGTMIFDADTALELSRIPTVIGFKDGVGDLARMQAIVTAIRSSGDDDFMFFNGLPTAEVTMRAYRATGVPLYSSAVFAFAPQVALAFHAALQRDDQDAVETLLREFYLPFVEIRDRGRGYHVSLVKAAVRAGGRPVGTVRPPITEPADRDLADLEALVARVQPVVDRLRPERVAV